MSTRNPEEIPMLKEIIVKSELSILHVLGYRIEEANSYDYVGYML
jgi:hypothetical protein